MTLREQVQQLKVENVQLQQRIAELEAQLKESNNRGAGRKQKLTDAQIEQIKIMHESGQSIKSISLQFECSVGTIHKALHSEIK